MGFDRSAFYERIVDCISSVLRSGIRGTCGERGGGELVRCRSHLEARRWGLGGARGGYIPRF